MPQLDAIISVTLAGLALSATPGPSMLYVLSRSVGQSRAAGLASALGLGLASTIPGRSPLLDGFGLIAFASVFPIMAVFGYAKLADWQKRRKKTNTSKVSMNEPSDERKPT